MNTNLDFIIDPEPFTSWQVKIDYVGSKFNELIFSEFSMGYHLNKNNSFDDLYDDLQERSFLNLPDVLLLEIEDGCFPFIEKIKESPMLHGVLIVLLSEEDRMEWREIASELQVHDYYTYPFSTIDLNERIKFLLKLRIINPWQTEPKRTKKDADLIYRMPLSKRVFDIVASSVALFLLSPLFIIIAIAIRLESKGAVIYRSKRAGTGYKVFDFYKFRSMQTSAEVQLAQLSNLNQYTDNELEGKSAFIKIVNDPRITRVGKFIRNTSIDELPQLFNILLGDMSFVGNRPLPLYEAELLTSNEWSMRFLGPAGLTGLWQVNKRGKKEMSERERKQLDNDYAVQHSFWLDLKIILKTFPALIQNEKV